MSAPRRFAAFAAVAPAVAAASLAAALLAPAAARAAPPPPAITHHTVEASLDVPNHRIRVTDRMTLERAPDDGQPFRFLLHGNLDITSVQLGGEDLAVSADEGWNPRHFWKRPPYAELDGFDVATERSVAAPAGGWGDGPVTLVVSYRGVIADSLHAPDRAYGRSFETTTGRIVDEGAFLSGGTFWIPWSGEGQFTYDLAVETPAPWKTMSQGRLERQKADAKGRVTMRWICSDPMEEIYLIAGPYVITRRDHRGISLETWVYDDTPADVSEPYLDAAAEAIDRYSEEIGPYPFTKFALVENYWQTGYGMPSFTFLGDRVIRLPFIVHTSYPHEILHNWWGNCVGVEGGNWCEGLTTYGADYAAKEAQGGTAARDYRRDTLLGYRDFAADGGKDFPLARFRERDSAATQAVGYGKTLMVFHMLRRAVGDDAFREALRRFYRDNRFRAASWDDVRIAFEDGKADLSAWFDQWVDRPGAIRLTLADVGTAPSGGGKTVVRGALVQEAPAFDATIPVVVEGAGGERTEVAVASAGERTAFEIPVGFRPVRVSADPGFDLFRILHTEEVAPTLSGVLGAETTLIVLGKDAGAAAPALRALAEQWASDSTFTVAEEADGDGADFAGAVWYFGDGPASRAFRASLPAVAPESGTLVAAGRRGGDPDRPAAVLWPENADVVPAIGRKTPHYSKYSYLVFDGENNVAKGAWDPGESPLVVSLAPGEPGGTR